MFSATAVNVLPDEGPVRTETCSSFILKKKYRCELNVSCVGLLAGTVQSKKNTLCWQDEEFVSVKVKVGGTNVYCCGR
jgi:hypothetical protein